MAIVEFQELLLAILCFFLLLCFRSWNGRRSCRSSLPTNWPLVGMLPELLKNIHRVHDFVTDILRESGGTFEFKGPCFGNMDMLVTSDPSNIHYILSRNFKNFPKGPEFQKIFDILGDGIFNSDSDLWDFHRKTTLSLLTHPKFQDLLERTAWEKAENGLFPVLDLMSGLNMEFDLQEIFQRFTFDSICKLVLDHDPESLSVNLPHIPCEKAFTEAEEGLLHRHLLPESCWKLQRWFGIGKEKRLGQAWETFDKFIYSCISSKQTKGHQCGEEDFDFLTAYTEEANKKKNITNSHNRKFLRDTLLSLMIAGKDTTSTALTWFFWLLATNPSVQTKIREEINRNLFIKKHEQLRFFTIEESRKLMYLHGALCEALRLFPPVALEHKAPVQDDILPSGHKIGENTKVVLSFYSMGRMENIWGKDFLEFKPERWMSERGGGVRHEASFKFPAFHAGPRTCLGKEMAFVQMKIVASAIIHNYDVKVVEGQPASPSDSIILQMKNGLKAVVTKRF